MKRFIIMLLLIGCEGQQFEGLKGARALSTYFRDKRTGLCFMLYERSATNVPCTSEVLKLITKD